MANVIGVHPGPEHFLLEFDDGTWAFTSGGAQGDNINIADGSNNDNVFDAGQILANAPLNGWYLYRDSTGEEFTLSGGTTSNSLLITRADGSTAVVQEPNLWYDYMTVDSVSDTTARDGTIDVEAVFTHAGASTSAPVKVFEDSTGAGFEISPGNYTNYMLTTDTGETIFFPDPFVNSSIDRLDPLGGATNPGDGTIDVAGIVANVGNQGIYQFTDTTSAGFTITPGGGYDLILTRDDGSVFVFDGSKMSTLDNVTYAAPGAVNNTGVIDVNDFPSLLDNTIVDIYGFVDSSGQSFEITQGSNQYLYIHREDGTVLAIGPEVASTANWINRFDRYSTTDTTSGVSDGIVDIAAIHANLNNGSNAFEFYDGTGGGFQVISSGGREMVILRDNGEMLSLGLSETANDNRDLYSDTGITGGANDGRIDISTLSSNLTTGQPGGANLWVGTGLGAAPCFTRGTLIETADGQIPIEQLNIGDKVRTKGNGFQKIKWIGSRKISSLGLKANPNLRPVRITAGALGRGLPTQDLIVSRQHRMFIRSKVSNRMFGENEVLISAIALTEMPGIYVDEQANSVEYFHIAFENHEIVFAEGALTESLYLGPNTFEALPEEAVEELKSIFPQLNESIVPLDSARFIPETKDQKALVARMVKNNQTALV